MKLPIIGSLAIASILLNSCASNGSGEEYDLSNPYAAPEYSDDSGSPFEPSGDVASDVNPAYDAPAVYEEPVAVPSSPSPAPRQVTTHTVVRGDSLWALSKKYGVSIDAIKDANGLTTDVVVLGSELSIPSQ